VYSDPRRHHGRQIGCDGIARVIVKRDVKADSVTPASLKRGCPNLAMFCEGPRPKGQSVALPETAKLCPLKALNPRSVRSVGFISSKLSSMMLVSRSGEGHIIPY
jgi:hypothetical protein